MNGVIEFEVISKKDVDVKLSGYVYADDLDDDVTDIYFYDDCGLEAGNYVPKPHCQEGSSEFEAYYDVVEAWKVDDLFLQYLSDYSDENRTVDRGDYFLKINEGAKMELEFTSIWDCPEFEGNHPLHHYWAKVVVKFNGKNIMDSPASSYYYNGWDDLLNAMQEIYGFDKGYIQNKAFWMEMPKGIYKWCEESYMEDLAQETIEEYVDVCREYFAQALTSELSVASIDETLEQEMDTNADDWDLFIMDYFTGKSEDEFKQYLVEQGYEF